MTPAAVMRDVRDQALDGLVHNQDQRRLIYNPDTEAADSLIEHLALLARTSAPEQRPHIKAALDIARRISQSNRLEGARGRQVAGSTDRLADELQRITQGGVAPLGRRRAARELRGPLANLVNPLVAGTARDEALAAVRDVVSRSSRDNVLSNTVRHEIGPKRYALLVELVSTMDAAA